MPKRAPSPPPPDDEPKYFTVYEPYPKHANFELPGDYITFAKWIATCIGKEPLLALHHKPSARSMVLIEISRSWRDHHVLLGEHRWCEFLKNPTDEEKTSVTQIFHSVYSSGRDAQKDGWKKIDVQEWWFKEWSPFNKIVHYPYPATHYCDVPPEDRTSKALCRPLPVAVKPPPEKPRPPVVGSVAWASNKVGPSATQGKGPTGAWANRGRGRGGPALSVSTRNTNASQGKGGNKPPSAATPTSAVAWNKPIHTTSSPATAASPAPRNAWAVGPPKSGPPSATSFSPPKSAAPSVPTQPSSTPLSTASSTSPDYPPGISRPSNTSSAPPGLVHPSQNRSSNAVGTSTSSGSGSSSSSIADWAAEVDAADGNEFSPYDYIEGGMRDVKIVSVSSVEDELLGAMGGDPDDPENYVPEWEKNIVSTGSNLVEAAAAAASNEDAVENLWEKWDTKESTTEPLCPTHGKLCKKGICRDAAKAKYEQKKKEKAAEQKNQSAAGKKNWRKGGRNNSEAGWRSNNSERTQNRNDRSSAGSSSNGGSRSVSRAGGDDQLSGQASQAPQPDDDAEPWD